MRWRRAFPALPLLAGCAGTSRVDPVAVPPADSTRAFVAFRAAWGSDRRV